MTVPTFLAAVDYYEPWWIQIIKGVLIFALGLQLVPLILIGERKILGRFQGRYGPNRVGPFGALQPLADIVKLATKESFRPRTSIGWLFRVAPVLSVITAVRRVQRHPVRRHRRHLRHAGRPLRRRRLDRPAVPLRLRRGRLLRDHARRLGQRLEVLVPGLDARGRAAHLLRGGPGPGARRRRHAPPGPCRSSSIVHAQDDQGLWFIVPQFVGFLIFLVASFAETNRAPFDLVEADAELVGGYNTEYGGGGFASYFFAEYLNVLVISGICTTVFLGGWLLPFGIDTPGALQPVVVLAKMSIFAFFFIWVRATLPRLRYDQLMSFGWKVLLPLATLNALVTAIVVVRMTWPPSPAELHVVKPPEPSVAGGFYRAFGETLRGLKTTFARVVEGTHTIQYPEEKVPVYPRFRGRHRLHRFEDTGLEKCVGCSLCAAACPADCIRVVAAENTAEHRVSAGERYAAVYEINLSRCIFCGYCEVACPFDAITMGQDYEMSDYNRSDLIFTKEMLLAEPFERTPLRAEGE